MQFLVMSKLKPGATIDQVTPILPAEARATWAQYKRGVLRQLYSRRDSSGIVGIFEADSFEQLKAELATLPLVEAGLIDFDHIPLAPYASLEILFGAPAR